MKNFDIHEFDCKCGCNENKMDNKFLEKIDNARDIAGVPFIINSGYRCPKHNSKIGSTSDNHTKGVAADIKCTNGPTRIKILYGLIKAGFKRIGIHKKFIHADTNDKVDSAWVY